MVKDFKENLISELFVITASKGFSHGCDHYSPCTAYPKVKIVHKTLKGSLVSCITQRRHKTGLLFFRSLRMDIPIQAIPSALTRALLCSNQST